MINTEVIDITKETERALEKAAAIIKTGGVVAFPTETVYGLGADALNEKAVAKIFEAKGRPADNPLIVHVESIDQAEKFCILTPIARKLFDAFWPGPFTGVLRKKGQIPDIVTAGLDTVAVRMPNNIYALALIKKCGCPIAAPSANLSTGVSPTAAEHVKKDLQGKIPLILDGGSTNVGLESTVCNLTGQAPVILRPGGITFEMLQSYYKDTQIVKSHLQSKIIRTPASPGMKYRHYSPKAKVVVIYPDEIDFKRHIQDMINEDLKNNLKTVILCTKENAIYFDRVQTVVLGSIKSLDEIAKKLFAALRNADATGADKIYFEALPEKGLGLAIMNRVLKAAF